MKLTGLDMIRKYRSGGHARLKKQAEAGDTGAMRSYAYYLLNETGRELTPDEAALCLRYLETAAAAGDTDAMLDLGGMYISGNGVPADPERGLQYYFQAMKRYSPYAYHRLGSYYLYDDDTEGLGYLPPTKDPDRIAKAQQYFLVGAAAGHSGCLNEAGIMYMTGELGEPDPKKALGLFLSALHSEYDDPGDHAQAAYNIARCFHYGTGTKKDLEKAGHYALMAVNLEEAHKREKRTAGDYFLNQYREELTQIREEMKP